MFLVQATLRLPSGVIQQQATGLRPPLRTRMAEVSTFSAAKSARISRPSISSPTLVTKAAESPSRAAPTAASPAGPPP